MPEALKHVYNEAFFRSLSEAITANVSAFDSQQFLRHILSKDWPSIELKARMRHVSHVLYQQLPGGFKEKADLIVRTLKTMTANGYPEHSLELMCFPDFIEVYGQADFDTSISAFEVITQSTSCEFGVRPFLIQYTDRMIEQMVVWSRHDHPQVRRLSSEGSRPRLPWAMAIPYLKKDPTPILPILELLKNDPAETVRRSVANSLNDISKDNPQVTIEFSRKWYGSGKETDWVIKHACRTLLKDGNVEVLGMFGFNAPEQIRIDKFRILTPKVKVGERLRFQFELINTGNVDLALRLEYGLYYKKANGTLSRKVFKISEKRYSANSRTTIDREQPFKEITTRKFYKGRHKVAIIVNGSEFNRLDFELV